MKERKSIRQYIRKDLQEWENYQVQPVTGRKMDANESPFPLYRIVREELAQWLLNQEDLRYYPDTDAVSLREAIARFYQIDPKQVVCGVGSDQIIDYLTKLFLEPGETILVPEPSFSMYQTSATVNHGRAVAFKLEERQGFAYPIQDIIDQLRELQPKILFLCSPNNPTGMGITRQQLTAILEQADCVVALDEAYGEFAGENFLDLIQAYPNLICLRTFSKAYGLAGLRVGYAIGAEEMIAAIDTVRAPYNLNTFSQMAAELVLGRPEYKEHIDWIIAERERMYRSLTTMQGLYCFPSKANYLFIRSNVEQLGQKLLERGLLVRRYTGALSNYIRVSVADQETNTLFLDAMKELHGGMKE